MMRGNAIMRIAFWLPFWAGLAAGNLGATTVRFQVINLGSNSFTYNYSVSGIAFQQNEELDIRFDPALYGILSTPVAGPGFRLTLLQPNNPPGTFGDYDALAMINNPSITGPFGLNFTFLGTGQPGSQPFLINQFDQSGNFISTVEAGFTSSSIPEPASLSLSVMGLLVGGILFAICRGSGDPIRESQLSAPHLKLLNGARRRMLSRT
jgi:hypothetical protein